MEKPEPRPSVLLSLVVVAVLPALPAEPAPAQEIRLGATAGPSFSTFRTDGWEYRTGYALRGMAELGLADGVSGVVELGWVSKGAESRVTTPEAALELDYLELGVLARYAPGVLTREGLSASLLVGPTLGFLASCRTRGRDAERYGDAASPDETVDCDRIDTGILDIAALGEEVNDWATGLSFGLQMRLGSGPRRAVLDVRYDLGLSEVERFSDRSNRAVSVSVGVVVGRSLPDR